MRAAEVIKGVSAVPTEENLQKINAYTRREYTADEIYVFSVVLCDNDVDRDYERFTVEALFEMEKLFVGKTGICDHNPKADNQCARIFECEVEAVDGKKTATGDDYFRLKASAYMPRTEENRELINRIDSGICKEVSVGLSAKNRVCSVCSKQRGEGCCHIPGEVYGNTLCYFELSQVEDAYEWSFVAVPAQREAGVVKSKRGINGKEKGYMNNILKSLSKGEEFTLCGKDCEMLANYITRLEKRAMQGDKYRQELEADMRRLYCAVEPMVSEKTVDTIVASLDTDQLKELFGVYKSKAKSMYGTGAVQTRKDSAFAAESNKEYSI